jgi:hypothetical protein
MTTAATRIPVGAEICPAKTMENEATEKKIRRYDQTFFRIQIQTHFLPRICFQRETNTMPELD